MKYLVTVLLMIASFQIKAQEPHNECVAVFHQDNMVVSEFSPRGKSILSKNAIGSLTVNLVEIGDEVVKGEAVEFYVAIKDAKTNSLTMVNAKHMKSFTLATVASKVAEGDKIVILLKNDKYALPTEQHEITIVN